jgi:hypothetical protein
MCTHCGLAGHTVNKCYKLHGFPPGFKFTRRLTPSVHSVIQNNEGIIFDSSSSTPQLPITAEQCQKLLEFLQTNRHHASANQVGSLPTNQDHLFSNMTCIPFSLNVKHSVFHSSFIPYNPKLENPWIIDTGATDHMISCVSLFSTIIALVSTSVKLPNGDLVSVTHIGTVQISKHLILTNVLCVPSFSFNLILAAKLIKQLKCCLIFINNYCFIQNLVQWRTIGVGEEKDGLFYLMKYEESHPQILRHVMFL